MAVGALTGAPPILVGITAGSAMNPITTSTAVKITSRSESSPSRRLDRINLTSALADLQKALAIAAPRQYLRVFLDEAGALRAMVNRLDPERMRGSEAAPLARQLHRLIGKSDGQGDAEHLPAVPAMEELTRREVAILKRLESGLSNKEIAQAIFISDATSACPRR